MNHSDDHSDFDPDNDLQKEQELMWLKMNYSKNGISDEQYLKDIQEIEVKYLRKNRFEEQ